MTVNGPLPRKLPVAVYDLTTLRFTRGPGGRVMSCASSTGEVLAVTRIDPALSDDTAAYRCLEQVQSTARVQRADHDGTLQSSRVVVYNPLSGQAALRDPELLLFTGFVPLSLDLAGSAGTLTRTGEAEGELRLEDGQSMPLVEISYQTLSRALAAA